MDFLMALWYIYKGDNMIKKDTNIKTIIEEKTKKFNKNTFKTTEILFLIIISAFVGIIMGYILNKPETKKVKSDRYLNEIVDQYNYIVDNYYESIDKEKIVSGAIEGMIKELDDNYAKLIEKNNQTFDVSIEGQYTGIGIEVCNDELGNIVIFGVLKDSPALKAGIKPGDILKEFDHKSFENKDLEEFSEYSKNNKKENVDIVVERNGEILNFQVNRENLVLKSVLSNIVEEGNHKIGYIYISMFSNTTASQFSSELKNLEEQNIDSLIIDVRENSGGSLFSVISILSQLMDSKNVIYQIKTKQDVKKYYSLGNKTKEYPIVVVQNKNSASAAELLSAALKESYGAKIVGETSFGKGTVQELVSLSNGDKYKFTTKSWLTPNGNSINKKGIEPDFKIELDLESDNDNQIDKAIEVILKESEK